MILVASRLGVQGSHGLHFDVGMCTGTVSTGPSRLAKYNEACSQKMTDSEVAAIAARLCNLTQIYSDSSRRACILASEGTLCKDAHIETDTSSSIRTNNDDANDNPFSASTSIAKITHGSATTAHATEQASKLQIAFFFSVSYFFKFFVLNIFEAAARMVPVE